MAEDLDDGEFWLPSQFLTDDDILMDFDFSATVTTAHGGTSSASSSSFSDFAFTESDEDDTLTHQDSPCPVHSKVCGVLSSSPQSTLCGCVCNSRESVTSPQQPQGEATVDLLNKAAGEVARLKTRIENKKVGTGFFDCSQKGVSYPPPLSFRPQFLHFPPVPPPMIWPALNTVVQQQRPPQQPPQNRATKSDNKSNTNNNNNNNNRPLGLPPSAWPPLQAQPPVKSKAQPKPVTPLLVGPPKGTGVFLPRRVDIPATQPQPQPRKKDGNTAKSKSGKGSSQSHSNNRRNFGKALMTTTTTANHNDIQLPQEWTY